MLTDTLSRAVAQTGISIVITDSDGVIEYVNPAFEALTGFSRAEVIGKTPRVLRSGVLTKPFYTNLWNTVLAGKTFHATFTNRRADGKLFDQDQTITPIRASDGRITHFVSAGCDVTARRRAGAEHMYQALEREAMRVSSMLHDEVGQFLAMAHMTLVDLSRALPRETSERIEEVRRYLDHIEDRMREVAGGLRPGVVADLGLVEAIRFAAKGCARRLGIPVRVAAPDDLRCPASIETLLYRLVQDALTTVALHAETTRVEIALTREVAGRRLSDVTICCAIACDAVGWVDQRLADNAGLRLDQLQRHIEAIGGTIEVRPLPNSIELRAAIPASAV